MSDEPNNAKCDKGDELSASDVFAALVDLVIHAQDNKLNLFSGFLFFQSILLLAWATVWQILNTQPGRNTILFVLSLFGTISSIAWSVIESDYASVSAHFGVAAEELEKRYPPFSEGGPLTKRGKKVENKPKWARGSFLIGFVTWGFAVLYPVLEAIVYSKNISGLLCRWLAS